MTHQRYAMASQKATENKPTYRQRGIKWIGYSLLLFIPINFFYVWMILHWALVYAAWIGLGVGALFLALDAWKKRHHRQT